MNFVTNISCQKLRQKITYGFLMLLLFANACKKGPDAFKSYGKETTVTRPLGDFKSLIIGQKFRLFITQDTNLPCQISITYSANLIDKIKAKVDGNELKIRDENHYNWVRKLDVFPRCTLNIKTLEKLNIQGSAEVYCLDSIKSGQLDVQMNSVAPQYLQLFVGILSGSAGNTGNITFSGRSNIFTFSCEDGGWFDASNLDADDAYVRHYTDRDVKISPRNIFEAYVYSKGNIFYKTDPMYIFKKEEHGQGKVLKY